MKAHHAAPHTAAARGLVGTTSAPDRSAQDTARTSSEQWAQNSQKKARTAEVGLARQLGIHLLFLPSYSPNLNLIERPLTIASAR
jgi:hypothetical protein